MHVWHLAIADALLIAPKVFCDERGSFFESFNANTFRKATGIGLNFVQDNHSESQQGVLRGLHYQLPPRAQGKLVRVIRGRVFDVGVDIRKGSPTFGRWVGSFLSADNKRQFWIPPGFAHGFITLSPSAEVLYKTTDFYSPSHERCIAWNDPEIGIDWHYSGAPLLSGKDQHGLQLAQAEVFAYDRGAVYGAAPPSDAAIDALIFS